MPTAIVSNSESHPVQIDIFEANLPNFDIHEVKVEPGSLVSGEKTLKSILCEKEADALYMRSGHVTRDVIENAPNLQVIAINGSGYDHVDINAATENGITVTHSPDAPGPSVSEHAISLILTMIRNLKGTFELTSNGEWMSARENPPQDIAQYTIGVVGLGTIGFNFARRLRKSFDTDVVAYDPYVTGEYDSEIWPRVEQPKVESLGIELTGQEELFEMANIVSLHVPFTDKTEGLVSTSELQKLKGGYLVNTSRGEVVDEKALIDAVNEDLLAGVALDVLETEPPAPNNPLLSDDSVLITPHVAGVTQRSLDRAAALAAEKIQTIFNGGKPELIVNPSVLAD